jgi:HEAT repeat protein
MKDRDMTEKAKARAGDNKSNELVLALKEADDFTRAKIIEKLVSSPDKAMVQQVVGLLDQKNTSLRMDALDILKKTGNCSIETIIQLLYHDNEDVRVYGCEVLAVLKHGASLPYLIEKVREDNENVRNAAIMALGEFNDQRSVDVLLDVLEQEEWVAFSAIYSLAKIGSRKAVPALLNVFRNRGEELSLAACEALISFRDSETIDQIVDFIDHLERDKKNTFVGVIIEQGDDQVFQRLMLKMGNDLLNPLLNFLQVEKRKSFEAASFLVHFKHRDAARAMLNILKDMDPEEDEYASVLALFMELQGVWSLDLEEYLAIDEYVLPIIRACAGVGCAIDEPLLLKTFCFSQLPAKREIMKQLGKISNGNGYRVIREAMKDSDGHVQAEAVAIAGTMSLRELTGDILLMAKKGYPDVRIKAMLALIRLEPPMALAAIEWFVKEGNSDDKRTYLSVTSHLDAETNYPFLKELIEDQDDKVRQMTIRVIGNYVDHEEYLDLFREVLKGGPIPNEVLKVIGEKKLTGFRQLLLNIVSDPLQVVWTKYYALAALAGFADSSLFAVFVSALKEKDNLIKIGALKALSELRDKRAIPHVRPYTKSMDQDVKTAALMAVERLSQTEGVC